jgi:hypothetical protein
MNSIKYFVMMMILITNDVVVSRAAPLVDNLCQLLANPATLSSRLNIPPMVDSSDYLGIQLLYEDCMKIERKFSNINEANKGGKGLEKPEKELKPNKHEKQKMSAYEPYDQTKLDMMRTFWA